jgi:hypothetical protein
MPIIPQFSTATADITGAAIFTFPDVPQGELWCGTTSIPNAPSDVTAMVTASGLLIGSMHGQGSFGPWTCDHSQKLAISATGLTPGAQYQAVWHADSKGREFSTYPAVITTSVAGTVAIAQPVSVVGTVTANQGSPPWQVTVSNFPATQPVSGTVTALPQLAAAVTAGQVTMTGAAVQLPSHGATQGVMLRAPAANTHPLEIGPAGVATTTGLILDPASSTPLLPVSNSNALYAIGTGPDVISFVVT